MKHRRRSLTKELGLISYRETQHQENSAYSLNYYTQEK